MIAYTELKEEIARNIRIDANATDILRFGIVEGMNVAQRFILTTIPTKYLSEAIFTGRAATIANIDNYEWPGDFIRFVAAWIKYSATSMYVPLIEKAERQGDDALTMDTRPSKLYPIIQTTAERGFYVFPTPDVAVPAGLRLRYIYNHPTISSNQDSMLDSKWRNLMIIKATAYCLRVENRDLPAADKWDALVLAELQNWLPRTDEGKQ